MSDPTPQPKQICFSLPSALHFSAANTIHFLGAAALVVAAGAQANPDIVKDYAGSLDVTTLLGGLASFGAFAYHLKNQATAKAAVDAAKIAPPVDPSTNQFDPKHTAAVLVKQLVEIDQHDKAIAVAMAMKPPEKIKFDDRRFAPDVEVTEGAQS